MADGGSPIPGTWLGRGITDVRESSMRREWLLTNGLGGYAMGTIGGPATRVYHGLLIAAVRPPADRVLLVGPVLEWVVVDGRRFALHALERPDGHLEGQGFRHLESVRLEGSLPVWTWQVGGIRLERRTWMIRDANATVVRWRVVDAPAATGDMVLEVAPLLAGRDHHGVLAADLAPSVIDADAGVVVTPGPGLPAVRLAMPGAAIRHDPARRQALLHRAETARGLPDRESFAAPVTFVARLQPGTDAFLLAGTEAGSVVSLPTATPVALSRTLDAARDRQRTLLAEADGAGAPALVRRLVLAADAFIVRRTIPGLGEARTVIAGYPWFTDWGRDTMIALPGLTLATGRAEDAAAILRAFAAFERDGLLPNAFPDRAGDPVEYHTVDAALWFVHALAAFEAATRDVRLVAELRPVVRRIVDAHVAGTRFGIGVDPADGLLRAGEPGVQLTWMDARVDGRVITPRIGKPVEIQALWITALRHHGRWEAAAGNDRAAGHLAALADRATIAFGHRFPRPGLGWLADVVDGPDGDDVALRPNQLIALAIPDVPLVDDATARRALAAVTRELLTPMGLRSLARHDPAYRRRFDGPPHERDAAYHQGTVWTWLLGPYLDALERHEGQAAAQSVLAAFALHLDDACLGQVSEVAEPEPPYAPRGAVAQAWGVAEVLRVARRLLEAGSDPRA